MPDQEDLEQALEQLKTVLDETPLSIKHRNPVYLEALSFYQSHVRTYQVMHTKRRKISTPLDERPGAMSETEKKHHRVMVLLTKIQSALSDAIAARGERPKYDRKRMRMREADPLLWASRQIDQLVSDRSDQET